MKFIRWHEYPKELPEQTKDHVVHYLVYIPNDTKNFYIARFNGAGSHEPWSFRDEYLGTKHHDITHWRKLPKPPKK